MAQTSVQFLVVYTCGMSVRTMTCGRWGAELIQDTLTGDDGNSVHSCHLPNGHSKINSPMCCGQDMACSAG